jgi:hypothetical protein
MNKFSGFLTIPSFYGFLAWTVSYSLYKIRLIDWAPSVPQAEGVFLLTILLFLIATIAWYQPFNRLWRTQTGGASGGPRAATWLDGAGARTLLLFHVVGLAGISWHLYVLITGLGGVANYLGILVDDSQLIRQFEIEPYGIYLSYFGWIAIPITIFRWRFSKVPLTLKLLTVAQAIGNILFIDRTRPIWLLFVSMLMVSYWSMPRERSRIVWYLVTFAGVALGLFVAVGHWIGKTGEALQHYGGVSIDTQLASIYYYLTSGFPYMESLIALGEPAELELGRTLYPLYKVLSWLELAPAPPPQILQFEELPFPTNAGTFLEPYFSDGGYLLLGLAAVVYSFGLNLFGYLALATRSIWGGYIWATFCFVAFISFFVPKLGSAPVWLFCLIAASALMIRSARGSRISGPRGLAAKSGRHSPDEWTPRSHAERQ